MSMFLGESLVLSLVGSSHGREVGIIFDGIPKGTRIDLKALQAFLDRRAPGRDKLSTSRKEPDVPVFKTGVSPDGVTDGTCIHASIRNTNTRPKDYETDVPRPGHADWPARVKYGPDYSFAGGGAFSGRMTAPLCIAGGIALQMLAKKGISISARAESVGGVRGEKAMREAVLAAKAEGDSVGGVIAAEVTGMPVGVGGPLFEGLESRLAQLVFGIPAVKGFEIGLGFAAAGMRGSENNDPYRMVGGRVKPVTNNAGGLLGGLTTGEPIVFRVAMKPTPSIARPQRSVNLATGEDVELRVRGRHDPCVVFRAVPCVEAAAALAILDEMIKEGYYGV